MPASIRTAGEPALPHPTQHQTVHGHAAAVRAMLDAYRSDRLHHAWLIGGPKGIGKATLAWHFARFILANSVTARSPGVSAESLAVPPDAPAARQLSAGSHGNLVVLERQWNEKTKKPYSEIRVDDVRNALGLFQRASASGGYRICIIDSAEDLNRSSANALLKVIEEPPPRSLFLIVAHRPGQTMPTLVSRARRLILPGLSDAEVVAALRGLGEPWGGFDETRLDAAAKRARGSVSEALRLLEEDALDLDQAVGALLDRLPNVDWRGVHRVADRIGMSSEQFETVLGRIYDWLDACLHARAGQRASPGTLMRLAESWEAIRAKAREADVLNLDKRPVLLSVFDQLARAVA